MNELTQILAVIVVLAHCVVIFWPRRPITEPTNKDGMPIVWHNQDDSRQDIACVWQEATPAGSTTALAVRIAPVTSFSDTVQPLKTKAAEGQRSAA